MSVDCFCRSAAAHRLQLHSCCMHCSRLRSKSAIYGSHTGRCTSRLMHLHTLTLTVTYHLTLKTLLFAFDFKCIIRVIYILYFVFNIFTCLVLSLCFLFSRRVGGAQAYTGELFSSGASLEPAAQTQWLALSVSAAA